MKTLIVGGGLSGLALAETLEVQGDDYVLVEARPRLGGRIITQHHGLGYFDLGPAWYWPGQPRIAALIARLSLQPFEQFCDGGMTFEDERGHVQRSQGPSSMQGSLRLVGGLGALIDALAERLPNSRIRLNAMVTRLQKSGDHCIATLSDGAEISADQVVLALPPRVAAQFDFSPALPAQSVDAMHGIATWMAGQAKAIAVYQTPIWRKDGLSGDAMSRRGPMVEIHDASPDAGGPYALFGFIGIPPDHRADESLLRENLKAQLIRLFGQQAASLLQLYIKDWAADMFTSTEADKEPLYAHPTYGLPKALTGLWDNRLHFAGTEVAPTFGGYLEGALEAAEIVFNTLNLHKTS